MSTAHNLKTSWSLLMQRARESNAFNDVALLVILSGAFLRAWFGRSSRAVHAFAQVHRATRRDWMRRVSERYVARHREQLTSDRVRPTCNELQALFGNRLMVLKGPSAGGEKGVLFLMVSETFELVYSGMNLDALMKDYTLVFEPSWSGYCHPGILQFANRNEKVFVLAAEAHDFDFLTRLGTNLIPVPLGPCDWVDPNAAAPYLDLPKQFDIVMNSSWAPWKRHYVLFRMLANSRRKYKVLLLGLPWFSYTKHHIESLAERYGILDQLTIKERLPYHEIMEFTCRSNVSILLSLKEGSNRAIAESIFCNVPSIVLTTHVGGIRKNIVAETGKLSTEDDLEHTILTLSAAGLQPRNWAMENISCIKSTEKLNKVLRDHALQERKTWTIDIAVRSNSPESKYASNADAERLRPWNDALAKYMR